MRDKIFNVPNSLSFLRIFLAAPLYYYLAVGENIAAFIVILIAVVTDILDGFLARKLNIITNAGKVLDPLADKICTTGGFLALAFHQGFPLWVMAVIIGRDVIILIGSLFILRRKFEVMPSNKPGKITIILITLYAASFILKAGALTDWLLVLVAIMIIYSSITYARVLYQNIFGENE